MKFKVGDKIFLPPSADDDIGGTCYIYIITEIFKSFINGAAIYYYRVKVADDGCHLEYLISSPVSILDNKAVFYDSPEGVFWRI